MLNPKTNYYEWTKGQGSEISVYFTEDEFSCPCIHASCVSQRINRDLTTRLFAVRQALRSPIHITSGFRCHEHQLDLAAKGYETAKGLSQHELGNAADVQATIMGKLRVAVESQFTSIGYANTFLHVDTRSGDRKWYYAGFKR